MPHLPIPSDENELPVPAVPKKIKGKKHISPKAAQAAANIAGFTTINAHGLQKAGVLGEFIGQTGALHIGRSLLAFNASRQQAFMEQANQWLARADQDNWAPEGKLALLRMVSEMSKRIHNTAVAFIESDGAGPKNGQPQLVPPAFAPPSAIAVSIQNNSSSPQVTVNGTDIIDGQDDDRDTPNLN